MYKLAVCLKADRVEEWGRYLRWWCERLPSPLLVPLPLSYDDSLEPYAGPIIEGWNLNPVDPLGALDRGSPMSPVDLKK